MHGSNWRKLADNLELNLTQEDQVYTEEYIKYLIFQHKDLPKRLLWILKDTNRIDIAEMLIFLYSKYLRYRTRLKKCPGCHYVNVINNFYKIECCNKKCKRILGKIS